MSVFSIGITGLNAAQAGMLTTSHNIANASTAGYNRQEIVQGTNTSTFSGAGFLGQGTHVQTVRRVYDQFLGRQVLSAEAGAAEMDAYRAQISQIDDLLADTSAGLSPALAAFFKGVQDVAANPASIPGRQSMLSTAQALAARFHALDQRMTEIRDGTNQQIAGQVTQINTYSSQLADINQRIILAQARGAEQPPNDLLDQRDQMLKDLNLLVRVSTIVQGDGSFNVFIGNGQPLVVGNQSYQLKAVQAADDPERTNVAIVGVGATVLTMPESQITGGSLGGLLSFRSQTLDGAQNALGRVALTLAQNFNDQHRLGQDLTGALGQNLFSISAPTVRSSSLNVGTGTAGSVTATSSTLLFGIPAGPAVDGMNASTTTGVLDFSTVSPQVDASVVIGGGGMSAFDYSGTGLAQFDVNFAGSATPVGITLVADYGSGAGLAAEIQNQIRSTAGNGAVTVAYAGGNITITNTGNTGAGNAVTLSAVDANAALATHNFGVSTASNGSPATPATATFTVGNGVDAASITLNGIYADQDAVAAAITAQLAASGNTTSTITATNNLGVITLANVGSPSAVSITASNQAAIDAGFVSDAGTTGNGVIATTNANLTIDGQAVLLNANYASYTAMASAIGTALGAGYVVSATSGGFTVARTTTGPGSAAINITAGDSRSDLAGITTAGTRLGVAGAAPNSIAGTGVPAVSIDATTIERLTSSDYRLTCVGGASPYQLTRLSDNQIQSFATLPQTVDGMTITVGTWTGAGAPAINDSILIQPTRSGAGNIAVAFSDARQIAAAAPIRTSAALANTGTASISGGTVNAPPPPSANLQHKVTLTFTSASTFDVRDATTATTLATGVAYATGSNITYNGWAAKISGNPAAGDSFTIEANAGGVADNRNAALLGALQTRTTMIGSGTSGPTASYQSAYTQIVSAIGSKANEVDAIGTAQQGLADHATQALQSLSGVNLDEEAANLLRYQQAYQASAKVLQIASKVLDEILALGR